MAVISAQGGANGKSTLNNPLLQMLGRDYAAQAAPEILTVGKDRHPAEVADLRQKRLVASIEVDEGKLMAEGLVKQLTGGGQINARYMRQDFFEFSPTHKLFLVAQAFLLLNLWSYVKWIHHFIPGQGPGQVYHHPLPLARWRLWLWEMVKQETGFSLSISIPIAT